MLLSIKEQSDHIKNKHGILVERRVSENDLRGISSDLHELAGRDITEMYCAVMPAHFSTHGEITFNFGREYPIDYDPTKEERDMQYFRTFQSLVTRYKGRAVFNNLADIKMMIKEFTETMKDEDKKPDVYSVTSIWYNFDTNEFVIEIPFINDTKKIMSDDELYLVRSKDELFRYAYFDTLTGMHNWNWMWEKLDLHRQEGIDEYTFVHFDVKDFRLINNIYGHEEANTLLRRIAAAIEECDWVYHACRCHNDNFAIMGKYMSQEEYEVKLRELFDNVTHLTCDDNYRIFYRCGIVLLSSDYVVAEDTIADLAKAAQRSGRDTSETQITFYNDTMHQREMYRSKLKAELQSAIDNDEFVVYLQPKYDIETEKVFGAEALVRWNYHHEELWMPGKFIPYLEQDGLVSKIDLVVFTKVCEFLAECKDDGIPVHPISVNLSRISLFNDNLVNEMKMVADKYNVDTQYIDIELTESAAYEDSSNLLQIMEQLSNAGFKISLDDFGTGFSALGLLRDMPVDTLKIDKSFVDGILNNSDKDNWLVQDIIQIAKHMEMICLAEGAESREQVDLLKKWGCEYIQGYYFSKPIPIVDYVSLLLEQNK